MDVWIQLYPPENERMSHENQWLVQMYFLLKVRPFLGDMCVFGGVNTIAIIRISYLDGIRLN